LADQKGISPNKESSDNEELKQEKQPLAEWPANEPAGHQSQQREDQERDQQGDVQRLPSSVQEDKKDDQANRRLRTLIDDTANKVIDSLTTTKPERNLIWLSVILASLFAIFGFQLANLLNTGLNTLHPLHPLKGYVHGLVWWGRILVAYCASLVFIFPFIFGFRASLAWPGRRDLRRLITYSLLSILVGLLFYSGSATLYLLEGYETWKVRVNGLQHTAVTEFVDPAALFASGALLADSLKPKQLFQREERGTAYRLLSKITRRSKEPNPLVTALIDTVPAIIAALIPIVAEAIWYLYKHGHLKFG